MPRHGDLDKDGQRQIDRMAVDYCLVTRDDAALFQQFDAPQTRRRGKANPDGEIHVAQTPIFLKC